ncbi:MAG: ribose ABC transporter permease [Pirellulaceae bacterium]|jgi:ribose transport system permease protein|nr:ribose ABC transporter permease [Pirellulaceae bacterium]
MKKWLNYALRQYGIVLAFAVVVAVLALLEPSFLTANNLTNVLRQTSPILIMAVGMTFVILTAGIDLSVGSLLALTGVFGASLEQRGLPLAIVLAVTLLLGAGIGALNGLVITKGRVTPFVVTLGTMSIARGLAHIYTGGEPISGLGDDFRFLGSGTLGGVPMPIILSAVTVLLAAAILRHTTLGRYTYAIGGNEEAVKLSGISVDFYKTAAYAICGLTAALGAMVLTSRLNAAESIAGTGYELDVIAAVVIGGTSLMGGRGGVGGTLIGALLIGTINNGMNLLMISSYYQLVVKGVIIVAAVLLDRLRD